MDVGDGFIEPSPHGEEKVRGDAESGIRDEKFGGVVMLDGVGNEGFGESGVYGRVSGIGWCYYYNGTAAESEEKKCGREEQ